MPHVHFAEDHMSKQPSREQYAAWAERARRQAGEATTDMARALHLEIAREYEAKVAATAPDDSAEAA